MKLRNNNKTYTIRQNALTLPKITTNYSPKKSPNVTD